MMHMGKDDDMKHMGIALGALIGAVLAWAILPDLLPSAAKASANAAGLWATGILAICVGI